MGNMQPQSKSIGFRPPRGTIFSLFFCMMAQATLPRSSIRFADRLVTALSGRVDLGARQVWGKLGNLLGLLSPAPSDVSEFCARGEPEASRCSLTVATGQDRWV